MNESSVIKTLAFPNGRVFPSSVNSVHSLHFFGREFLISQSVLVPRLETECLVRRALRLSREYHFDIAMDIGTGSGIIAVSVAAETGITTVATDISSSALATARDNIRRHDLQIRTVRADLLDHPEIDRVFAECPRILLLANLPYVDRAQIADDSDIHAEPALALFSEDRGFACYDRFFTELHRKIRIHKPHRLALVAEMDPSQISRARSRIIENCNESGTIETFADYAGDVRFLAWRYESG